MTTLHRLSVLAVTLIMVAMLGVCVRLSISTRGDLNRSRFPSSKCLTSLPRCLVVNNAMQQMECQDLSACYVSVLRASNVQR